MKGFDDSAWRNYNAKVDEKVELLRGLPGFDAFKKNVEQWKIDRCGFGLTAIIADNYCDKIIEYPAAEFVEWFMG